MPGKCRDPPVESMRDPAKNRENFRILTVKWSQHVVSKPFTKAQRVLRWFQIDTLVWKIGNTVTSVDNQRLSR
jgi:hypothetical protein